MKRILLVLFLLAIPSVLKAQSPGVALLTGNSQVAILTSYDGEAITVAGTAIGFTSSKINPTCTDCPVNTLRATRADCTSTASTALMNALSNGTTPTNLIGLTIPAGQSFTVYGYQNIAAFLAIRTAATSISMYCVYSRPQ